MENLKVNRLDASGRVTPLIDGSSQEKKRKPSGIISNPKFDRFKASAAGPKSAIESRLKYAVSHPMLPCMVSILLNFDALMGTSIVAWQVLF
jgi:hypothetical protein